jgi:hypothetical protein
MPGSASAKQFATPSVKSLRNTRQYRNRRAWRLSGEVIDGVGADVVAERRVVLARRTVAQESGARGAVVSAPRRGRR